MPAEGLGQTPSDAGARQLPAVVTVTRSPDRDFYHVEPTIATNPGDPREVVVAAMHVSSPRGPFRVRAYRSVDAGATWSESELPELSGHGCEADPWLVWGKESTVYLICLGSFPDPDGSDSQVFLIASPDAGRTWREPLLVPVSPQGSWDHPVVATAGDSLWIVGTRGGGFAVATFDQTTGDFGPASQYEPPVRGNHNMGGLAATASGTAFTYFTMRRDGPRPLYAVSTTGTGFSETLLAEHVTPWGFPMLAAGPSDRLHAVWLEGTRAAGLHVVVSSSEDGGRHWDPPLQVTSGEPLVFRARANLAVDSEGRIGITWFEAEDGSGCGDVVFHALAGGSSSPLARVRLRRPGPCPTDPRVVGVMERWPGGGDYTGIVASATGTFDLVWADPRDDGHEVRFARVRVER